MVFRKITYTFMAVALAVSLSLVPFGQAAYANTQAAYYIGSTLLTILAVMGINPNIGDTDLQSAITNAGTAYNEFLDTVTSDMIETARQAAYDSNPDYINNAQAWDTGGKERILADMAAAGEAGRLDLDLLSISQSGVLGLFPFLLSLYIEDITAVPTVIPSFNIPDFGELSIQYCGDVAAGSLSIPHGYANCAYYYNQDYGFWILAYGDAPTSAQPSNVVLTLNSSGKIIVKQYSDYSSVWTQGATSGKALINYDPTIAAALKNKYIYFDAQNPLVLKPGCGLSILDRSGLLTSYGSTINLYNPTTGWNTDLGTVTDNPDVNLGHDWWTDAEEKANADLLNPSAGAAVIGNDLVIDGDYIVNRGSIGILTPTDWDNTNSWSDALSNTHAGVIEGATTGTIAATQTATAVNTATGELVNGTVQDLVRPGSKTSISVGVFDTVIQSISGKFPFCIPADLHKAMIAMSAPPQAPAFDWVFHFSPLGIDDVTIHIDLSDFDSVALVLRVCLSVSMSIGLIFLSIRLLNMWGD